MRTRHLIVTTAVSLALLAALGCGAEPTPVPPTATAPDTPSPTPPPTAVIRSQVATTFSEPLSSGLSVADVVENALPSVARIVTGSGAGTGFVINESGLVVTNQHVVDGYTSVRARWRRAASTGAA